jgi:type I restriction enzyme M protein
VIVSAFAQADQNAHLCLNSDGNPEADKNKTEFENVPFREEIHAYFNREVKPYYPDAWIAEDRTRIGTEILFTRYFYKVELPEKLEKIESEIKALEKEIATMLEEVIQ